VRRERAEKKKLQGEEDAEAEPEDEADVDDA
jgi:hypothetical protein